MNYKISALFYPSSFKKKKNKPFFSVAQLAATHQVSADHLFCLREFEETV